MRVVATMSEKPKLIPGPDHPITVEPAGGRVVVRAGGRMLADSAQALVLREASYPPMYYLPRADVDMARLERSDHACYCPSLAKLHRQLALGGHELSFQDFGFPYGAKIARTGWRKPGTAAPPSRTSASKRISGLRPRR